jgi:hypothetical protein
MKSPRPSGRPQEIKKKTQARLHIFLQPNNFWDVKKY